MTILTPVGSEFLINTTIAGTQQFSSVAALANNRFVVTWTTASGTNIDTGDIYGQIIDLFGNKIGSEFIVSNGTAGSQAWTGTAALEGGGFVVVWEDDRAAGTAWDVRGQVFDANGNKVLDGLGNPAEFVISSATQISIASPAAHGLEGGGFVVAWNDSPTNTTHFRRYFADGSSVERQLGANNQFFYGAGTSPAIAALTGGGFVIAQQATAGGIQGTIYDTNGNAVGSPFFTINAESSSPRATGLPGGGFVFTWVETGDIHGRVFNAAGAGGLEFVVNSDLSGNQTNPSITVLPNGQFVVMWSSDLTGGSSAYDVHGRLFNVSGLVASGVGGEFVVNTNLTGNQFWPRVAADGTLLVAWTDDPNVDFTTSEIKARVFSFDTSPPAIANLGPPPTFVEGGSAVLLDANVDISDADLDALNGGLGNYGGAIFSVQRAGAASAGDLLTFDAAALSAAGLVVSGGSALLDSATSQIVATSLGGQPFGTGGVLGLTFSAGATSTQVDAIARAIAYANSSSAPPGTVALEYYFFAGDAGGLGTATATLSVNVSLVNDVAPTITNLGPSGLYQAGQGVTAAVFIDADGNANLADAELDLQNNYSGATLTISRSGGADAGDAFNFVGARLSVAGLRTSGGPASGQIELISNGDDVATWTLAGGVLTIAFGGGVTAVPTGAMADAVLRSVQYSNPNAPGNISLDVTFLDGGSPAPLATTVTTIVAVNTAPVVSTPATLTIGENLLNAAPQLIAPDITVSDGLNPNFNGGSVSVGVGGGNYSGGDRVSIRHQGDGAGQIGFDGPGASSGNGEVRYGGVVIGQASGGSSNGIFLFLNVTLGANATPEAVQALLRSVTYLSGDNFGFQPSRNIQIDVTDGDDGFTRVQYGLTIPPENDAPVVSNLDAAITRSTYSALPIDNDVFINDPDLGFSGDYNGYSLTISTATATGGSAFDSIVFAPGFIAELTHDAANHRFVHTASGAVVATYSSDVQATGVTFTLNFTSVPAYIHNAGTVRALVQRLAYQRTGDLDVHPATLTLTYTLNDGSGAGNATTAQDVVVTLTGNTAPAILDVVDNYFQLSETAINSGYVPIANVGSGVAFGDAEGNYAGGELRFHWGAGGTVQDNFTILSNGFTSPSITFDGTNVRSSGVIVGTISATDNGSQGRDLVIALNANVTDDVLGNITRALGYLSFSQDPAPTRVLEFTVRDGAGAISNTGGWNINVTAQNDAPQFEGLDPGRNYAGTPVQLDANVLVYDPEMAQRNGFAGDHQGFRVIVSTDAAHGGSASDVLAFGAIPGVTVDTLAGELRLTGTGEVIATFQAGNFGEAYIDITFGSVSTPLTIERVGQVVQSITYAYTGPPASAPATVTVNYLANDGTGLPNAVTTQSLIVALDLNNSPPAIVGLDAVRYFPGFASEVDTNVSVTDADLLAIGDYTGLKITLSTTAATGGSSFDTINFGELISANAGALNFIFDPVTFDQFATFTNTVTNDGITVAITLGGSLPITQAIVDRVMQSIVYGYSGGQAGAPAHVTLTIAVDDGHGSLNSISAGSIDLYPFVSNTAPQITGLDASRTFYGAPVVIDTDVSITDADYQALGGYGGGSVTLTTASATGGSVLDNVVFTLAPGSTIFVMDGGAGGNIYNANFDQIGVFTRIQAANGLNFSITFDAFNGTAATQANFDEVMRSLTYQHGGSALAGNVTLTLTYNDVSGPNGIVSQSIDLVPGIITGGTRIVDYATGSANNPADLSNNPAVANVIIDVGANSVIEDPNGVAVSRTVSNVITPVGSNVAYNLTDDFIITGTDGNDRITAGDGNDIIRGGLGADILNGGNGNNTFVVGSGEGSFDIITGGTGTDTLKVIEFGDFTASDLTSIEAIVFDDTSVQKQAAFRAEEVGNGLSVTTAVSGGLDGYNEIFFSLSTGTTLDVSQFTFEPGHFYQVTIFGDDSAETVHGAIGAANYFEGFGGADTFTGGDLGDTIFGGTGADHLSGGGGDDYFYADGAAIEAGDVFDGGGGFDRLFLYGTAAVSLVGAILSNVERIYLDGVGTGMRLELGAASQAVLVAGAFGTDDTVSFDGYLAVSDVNALAAAGVEHIQFKNADGTVTQNYVAGKITSTRVDYAPVNTYFEHAILSYDASGALTSVETAFDSGIIETAYYAGGARTHLTKADTLDAFGWDTQDYTYKPDGASLASLLETQDNNDTLLTTYGDQGTSFLYTDVSHTSPLATRLQTQDLAGKPTGSTITYDDGQIVTLDYTNGVLTHYENYDSLNVSAGFKRHAVDYTNGVQVRELLTLDNNDTYDIRTPGGVLAQTIFTDGSNTAPFQSVTVDISGGVATRTATLHDSGLLSEQFFAANGHKTRYVQTDAANQFSYDTFSYNYAADGTTILNALTIGDNGHRDVVNYEDGGSLQGAAFNDTLIGHLGMDTFAFGPGGGSDYVSNFENGVDKLDLSAFNIPNFGSLYVENNGTTGVYLSFGGGQHLAVNGVTLAQFDPTDVKLA